MTPTQKVATGLLMKSTQMTAKKTTHEHKIKENNPTTTAQKKTQTLKYTMTTTLTPTAMMSAIMIDDHHNCHPAVALHNSHI